MLVCQPSAMQPCIYRWMSVHCSFFITWYCQFQSCVNIYFGLVTLIILILNFLQVLFGPMSVLYCFHCMDRQKDPLFAKNISFKSGRSSQFFCQFFFQTGFFLLDLYVTRVQPSGQFDLLAEDFDYLLIAGVVLALILATFVLSWLSSRKTLNSLWK